MLRSQLDLSVVIPTLNEADNLPLLLKRIDASLRGAGILYEVIIVDDHSTDQTRAIALRAKRRYPISFALKQGVPGKAHSLLEGFKLAAAPLICMIDGDLQYPPESILDMYNELRERKVDIVITQRVQSNTSWIRRLSSQVFTIVFAKLLFGLSYDTQSGLKLFKREVVETIMLSPSPWSFDLEFIVRSLEHDYTISNHRIVFSERYAGQPKISVLKATFELAGASLRLRRLTKSKQLKSKYQKNLEYVRMSALSLLVVASTIFLGLHAGGPANIPTLQLTRYIPSKTFLQTATLMAPAGASQQSTAPTSSQAIAQPSSMSPNGTNPVKSAQATQTSTAAQLTTPSTSTAVYTKSASHLPAEMPPSVTDVPLATLDGPTDQAVYQEPMTSKLEASVLMTIAKIALIGGLVILVTVIIADRSTPGLRLPKTLPYKEPRHAAL